MKLFKRYLSYGLTVLLTLFALSSCSTGPEETKPLPEFSSLAAPGDSAHAYLSDAQFSELKVEIDYMPGYAPDNDALDSLKTFLQNRLNKSSISIQTPTEIPSGGKDAYSQDDILNIEEANRDNFTKVDSKSGNTLWVYFSILDGSYADNSNVLGLTYLNTSMTFFGSTIQNNSGGVGQVSRTKLEGTTYMHEFGHNMGLVANGTPMQQRHQANGAHCDDDSCLMYYAVETTDYTSVLMDSPMPDLDANCRADLQANGGK